MVAYRPEIGGTPEATAYAMPTGTSMAVSTMPATRSSRSQSRSYSRSVQTPGSQRLQPETASRDRGSAARAGVRVFSGRDALATSRYGSCCGDEATGSAACGCATSTHSAFARRTSRSGAIRRA